MLKKERQAYILHYVNLHNKVLSSLKQINADLCFLGINAIDLKHGTTDNACP